LFRLFPALLRRQSKPGGPFIAHQIARIEFVHDDLNRQQPQNDFAKRNFIAQLHFGWRIVGNWFVVDARFVSATQVCHEQMAVAKVQRRVFAMNVTGVLIAQIYVGINVFVLVFAPDFDLLVVQDELSADALTLFDDQFHKSRF